MNFSDPNTPAMFEYISHSLDYTPNDCKWLPGLPQALSLGSTVQNSGVMKIFQIKDQSL